MTSRFTSDAFSRRDFILGGTALFASGHLPAQTPGTAGFAGRDDVRAFCAELAGAHGFDEGWLLTQFEPVQPQPRVIELIRPPTKPGVRSWQRYRGRFVEPLRIREGRAFMAEHAATLARAEQQYGVPPHVVTAIIGVETIYGRHTGNFPVIGALATLAFDYPRVEVDEPEEEWVWSGRAAAESLIAAQDSLGNPLFQFNPDHPLRLSGRPFPAFPHDWAAVRIVCAKVIETLHQPGQHRLCGVGAPGLRCDGNLGEKTDMSGGCGQGL